MISVESEGRKKGIIGVFEDNKFGSPLVACDFYSQMWLSD